MLSDFSGAYLKKLKRSRAMTDKITQEDFLKLKAEMDKAEADTTPYIAVIGDETAVVGDPNNTEVKKQDYTATFLIPKSMAPIFPQATDVGSGYLKFDMEYKDIFVDARNNMKYTTKMAQLLPFYKKLEDSGDVSDMTPEEMFELFGKMEDYVVDAIYDLVKTVLKVDESIIGYMTPGSAIRIASSIIHDFPNVLNQADLFFD